MCITLVASPVSAGLVPPRAALGAVALPRSKGFGAETDPDEDAKEEGKWPHVLCQQERGQTKACDRQRQ
jgi:hypothetical protein